LTLTLLVVLAGMVVDTDTAVQKQKDMVVDNLQGVELVEMVLVLL
jgi:hypothetical protein